MGQQGENPWMRRVRAQVQLQGKSDVVGDLAAPSPSPKEAPASPVLAE